MIPVTLKPEPRKFDSDVRQPGKRFLATNPKPSSKEFKGKDYWKAGANDLHEAYGGICAYTCFYMSRAGSVDHFMPKAHYPQLAYEWDNFRLAAHKVNQYKADSMVIIDPCKVGPGWFVLDFPSCLVRPGDGLPDMLAKQVEKTIKVLKLNDDDTYVQERCDLMLDYAEGNVTLKFLSGRYPFLAAEIARQKIQETVGTLFRRRNS